MEKDMRFCRWLVRSLYRPGSLSKLAKELVRYKLDVVGVQEVRWQERGTVKSRDYVFFMEKEKQIINW